MEKLNCIRIIRKSNQVVAAVYIKEFCKLCGFFTEDYEIEYEVKKPHDYIETFNKILSKIEKEYVENSKSKYKRFLESMEGEQV